MAVDSTRRSTVRVRGLLAAVAMTVVAVFAMAAPASANPGNGAYVTKSSGCDSYPGYGTWCWDAKGVSNSTLTKSGNYSAHSNGEYTQSFTGEGAFAGCSDSSTGKYSYHGLYKDDFSIIQEDKSKSRGSFSYSCNGYTVSCTYEYHFHFANGELQISRNEYICTP